MDIREEIVSALEGKDETTRMWERHTYLHDNWKTLTDKEKEEYEVLDDYIMSKIDYEPLIYGGDEEYD